MNDKYLLSMPKSVRKDLINYLFNDIFKLFRGFFHLTDFRDSDFYYDMSFEMLPRKYINLQRISINFYLYQLNRYNPKEYIIK